MASVLNPEPFQERFDQLLTVIESLKRLQNLSSTLAKSVRNAEEIDLSIIDLVADAWLTILEDGLIRKGFEEDAARPTGDATIHWVTTEVLKRVEFIVGEINRTLDEAKKIPVDWAYLLADELDKVISVARTFHSEGQRGEIHRRQLHHAANLLRQAGAVQELRTITTNASQALQRAENSAFKASKAAGSTGNNILAQHYQDLAVNESTTAHKFRLWTIISTIVGGAIAGIFVLGSSLGWDKLQIDSDDWVHLVQRAITTVAVFGLSAYLARQAHQHRMMANWAGSLAVQLKTFEAFLDPIKSEEVRDLLRTSFATRVFGDHPVIKGEPSEIGTAGVAEKALDMLAKRSSR